MKRVSKAILIALAGLLALAVALIVGLNLYVQSPGAQARIQEELSKALRLPLKLTNTSVTPWSDLRITGITIPDGDANFLEAASFTANYRLFPLLENKLIITEMRVENPKVVWRQNPDGRWKLPEPEEAAAIARAESPAAAEAAPPPAIPGVTATEAPDAAKPEKKKDKPKAVKKKTFAVIVNRFEIKDGAFELFDKAGKPVAVVTGVNMVYTKLTPEGVEGTAVIGKAVWADGLTLENLRTPFSYLHANREFWLPEFTAALAGGALRGKFHSRSEAEHTPFNAALDFERINLDQLVTQSGGEAGQATGELRGKIEMRGETDRMERAEGSGRLEVREGRFRQLELFQTIGRFLNIREFADFHISEGQADFQIAGEKIQVERIVLNAPSIEMSAKGTVRFDKKVALDAQLAVDEALVKQLPGKVPEAFASDGQGRRTIDFTVSGTSDKLKTNLGDKLISQTISAQFGNLLGTVFDEKKEEEKRKKEEEKRKREEEERKKAEKKAEKERKKKDKEKSSDNQGADSTAAGAAQPSVTVPNP